MPGYREMMELFGFRSKNAVFKLINKLVERGIITKDGEGRLSPTRLFGEIKVLGTVEAGFPSAAEEELQDTMTLDEWLINNKEATYMLKVKGDSMIDAGIIEGDMVLVDRSKTPKNGDIVIAEVDGGWTMKYFRKTGNKVELIPANKKYNTIIPREDMRVAAVVISVIRKY
ncbi:repressor LexA [Candidatus Giovannonibacteria bacterium]|nr:repressor LexA [Candidatus Giovannonibacteria bacterium]